MILFDICSIPEGTDIKTWYDLYKEGLAIYDSKGGGVVPVKIDGDVSFIDVRNLTHADISNITERITKMAEEQATTDKIEADKVRENNRKLVEYLRDLNK